MIARNEITLRSYEVMVSQPQWLSGDATGAYTQGGSTPNFTPDFKFGGYNVAPGDDGYGIAGLQRLGIRNDDISGIRVPAGWQVTVYEHVKEPLINSWIRILHPELIRGSLITRAAA